jgi:hypothetical protein
MSKPLRVLILAAAFLLGAATGYHFGYDIGFERAVRTLELPR